MATTFFVAPTPEKAEELNQYQEMFLEMGAAWYYPAIKFLNAGTWNHTITVSSPVNGRPSDEDLAASWSLALSKLRRVVGEPQGWSPALGRDGYTQRSWSRFEAIGTFVIQS